MARRCLTSGEGFESAPTRCTITALLEHPPLKLGAQYRSIGSDQGWSPSGDHPFVVACPVRRESVPNGFQPGHRVSRAAKRVQERAHHRAFVADTPSLLGVACPRY